MAEDLRARVEDLLQRKLPAAPRVTACAPLGGGACQDNYRVDLQDRDDGHVYHLVLRSDARQSLPGSLNREQELAVIEAARRAGVTTPRARWLERGLVREGASAYFLDWAEGEAVGRRVVRNPELAGARAKLPGQLATQLARIHSVTPASEPKLAAGIARPGDGPDATRNAIGFLRRMMERLVEPRPAVELALVWLETNAPTAAPMTLVHGDFRTGNFLVTPDGLSAVLDWEFAHFGDPMEDVGWLCVRDWRFGQLALPVGGFAKREPFYEAYARSTGREIDRRRVHYWEVMGNVRWAVGGLFQGERYLSGEESDLELIAIARRAVEMEFEALRLIEKGA